MGLRGPSNDVVGDFMGSNRGKPDSRPMQDILAERNKPVYQIKPGRGGRRSQPRAGEGSAKLIKDTAEFFEPGYVHAARTGTVPETILGKTMLAAETALDLIPGVGGVLASALPFGYLKKIDSTKIIAMDKQSKGIHTPLQRQDVAKPVQDLVAKAVDKPALKVLRNQLRSMDDAELLEQTSGLINRKNIDKVDLNTVDEITGLRDSLTGGIENALRGSTGNTIDPSEMWKHAPQQSPYGKKVRQFGKQAEESIIKGQEGIEAGFADGSVSRIHGIKQTSEIVNNFATVEGRRRAGWPHARYGSNRKMNRKAQAETEKGFRERRKWEKETFEGMTSEDAVYGGGGFNDTPYDIEVDYPIDSHRTNYFEENWHKEMRNREFEQAIKSSPPQKQRVLNQIQETGTYDPKARFPKGFGENAETIREMQKQLNKKPKGGGQSFRYGQNRSPFV